MDRHPIMRKLMNIRQTRGAGFHWTVKEGADDPASKQLAQMDEWALKQMRGSHKTRKRMNSAIFEGISFERVFGEIRDYPLTDDEGNLTGQRIPIWVPTGSQHVDKRRMKQEKIKNENGEVVGVQWMQAGRHDGQFRPVEHPEWYLIHVCDDQEDAFGYGRGLRQAMYVPYFMLCKVDEEGLGGVERWARGILSAKLASNRRSSVANMNSSLISNTLNKLDKMRSRFALVMGKDDELNVLDGPGTGHQMIVNFRKMLIEDLHGLVLSGTLPFGAGQDKGTYGRAESERESSEDLMQADQEQTGETITDRLLGLMHRINKPVIEALGWGEAVPPEFKITPASKVDPKEEMEITRAMVDAGMDVHADEAYSKAGRTKPQNDDPIIKGRTAVADPFGGGAPFGGGNGFPFGKQDPKGQNGGAEEDEPDPDDGSDGEEDDQE